MSTGWPRFGSVSVRDGTVERFRFLVHWEIKGRFRNLGWFWLTLGTARPATE